MSDENKILSKSAQSVQQALVEKGLAFEVVELAASTRTAIDAANTIGCDVAQIMKSLLFCIKKTKQPVLVLASGINRVNEKAIEQWVGEKIVKADADFTRDITGFAIGGVPPIGHKQTITHIFIDEDLLKYKILWAAAGTPNAVFSLSSSDIESLTHGKVIAIK
ncbi:YbaK/aminoacyl-tRNA synthetase associated region [Legionella busanensis]|uniref:YbaK/aminoacyl-tRNA synthetase associated region n=1 Tax=Legionella busanensis TaxID=190655 RepID=A0A378KA67_9GAMM|nr:YbaK/EbsC family protein [Legionella busanensis]STX81607.1 YbaK/aminoacyl-tRNA synthetase associated region [Legionella busanensis]